MEHKRVVITGIGMAASGGIGKDEVFSHILEGKSNIKPIPDSFCRNYSFKSGFFVPFPQFNLSDYGIESRYRKMMQNEDSIAVFCALLALRDAGYSIEQKDKLYAVNELSDAGILVGTGVSGLQTAFDSYCSHNCREKSSRNYNRIVIPMMMPNSIAAWISIFFNIKGGAVTVNASCASGTIALGRAYRQIQNGYYTQVLAGGVECLKESTGAVMRGFDVLGTLTKSEDGSPHPFSEKRSGFLFSEGGGCIIVLEEREYARRRGAEVYAEIVDYCENSDAYGIVQINPDAKQIIRLLESLKGNREIDYINTHGTGTILNDSTETLAINKVFGDKCSQPLVNATKGIIGHTIGASGAIEAGVTALSLKKGKIHGNNAKKPLDINLVQNTIDKKITYALSVSYGFGGHNAGLVLKRNEKNG